MKTHTLIQGTPEWNAYRLEHFNASDAPSMLGVGTYETRTQLLHRLATGITPDVDAATQRRFDDGHRFEALARPIAESIIGEELYPVVGSEGKLSASFDGLTMDETICFEHKTLNDTLCNIQSVKDLPEQYLVQIEQQLMVSGANKCLFMASRWVATSEGCECDDEVHIWVTSNQSLRNALVQGWTQFAIDLEEYKRKLAAGELKTIAEKPPAEASLDLPALYVNATGEITDNNLAVFEESLTLRLAQVRSIVLVTDQDFSNAKEQAKILRAKRAEMELVKKAMLSQTVSIGEAARKIDLWMEDCRITALQLEKDVEREDAAKKSAMVNAAAVEFSQYVQAIELAIQPIQLAITKPDFAGAIKGKRNYASMQDAVDTALANGKIAANAIAKDVRAKLLWLKETSAGYGFLFNDFAQIISKPMEDFQLVITSRIEKHKADEAARIEAETARIQAEATAKAEREAAVKLAQEEARIRAEEQAKARAEAAALAQAKAEQDALITAERAKVEAEQRAIAEATALAEKNTARIEVGTNAEVHPVSVRMESAPVVKQSLTTARPTRMQLIEAIAAHYSVSVLTADEWLRAEFTKLS